MALAQSRLRQRHQIESRGDGVRGVEGAPGIAADHGADRFTGQAFGRARRLGEAQRAERLVDVLEDAQRIAAGLPVAQEIEVVAGGIERLRGTEPDDLREAGSGMGGMQGHGGP